MIKQQQQQQQQQQPEMSNELEAGAAADRPAAKRRRGGASGEQQAAANEGPDKWVVVACGRGHSAPDRQFSYRLSRVGNDDPARLYLDALVLHNGVCVLSYPASRQGSLSPDDGVTYSVVFDAAAANDDGTAALGEIKGKRKKGARKVKPGTQICSLLSSVKSGDGPTATATTITITTTTALLSPVQGHLLEINKNVERDGSLLVTQPQGTGFLAVVFPDAEIPSLDNGGVVKPKDTSCHEYAQTGSCRRGSTCKFTH